MTQQHTECPTPPPNLALEYGKLGAYGGMTVIALIAVLQGAAIMKMLVRRVALRQDEPPETTKKRPEKNP